MLLILDKDGTIVAPTSVSSIPKTRPYCLELFKGY